MPMHTPDRELSSAPRCDRPVAGDGIMSYHCSLPQGHAERTPEDPEPCYAVESSRSARAWDAWKSRQETDGQRPSDVVIACPACGEEAMVVTVLGGVCENCGQTADFQSSEGFKTSGPDPEGWRVEQESLNSATAVHTDGCRGGEHSPASNPECVMRPALRTRPEDQRLPDGDESVPDDQSLLIADIEARRKVGIARYGQGHRPFNGRDTLRDLYEEQMDLMVYLRSIVRMAEADREALVEAVTDALAKAEKEKPHWFETADHSDMAGVAVDRLMGWVAAQRMQGTNDTEGEQV